VGGYFAGKYISLKILHLTEEALKQLKKKKEKAKLQ